MALGLALGLALVGSGVLALVKHRRSQASRALESRPSQEIIYYKWTHASQKTDLREPLEAHGVDIVTRRPMRSNGEVRQTQENLNVSSKLVAS